MRLSFQSDRETHAFCHYHINVELRLRTEVYEGEVGLEEMKSMAHCMTSDPLWSSANHSLIDLRAASLKLNSNDIVRLALMQRQEVHSCNGWRVYVVSTSENFGVIRMLTRWARTSERCVFFKTRGEAEAWLSKHLKPVCLTPEKVVHFPVQPAVAPFRKIG